ncbi:hypothetical protein Heshes_21130 [Alicyclobacillus hesperidum]|uniref:Acyl-CoA thioesterase-1 n=1 Tax=Alicyclobacillus hesperidum TaxID=89784 RepID=A0A1H2XKL6_9BACL|nr:SGNH/GDSL hydrolase family protein [Alicyclobacillus hesperidum]GLV14429.1 hypothetical protein Heshes_21130 [Alicyclobacillus hesperidum]SDW93385.1 acyl-CoA thioesterase-1 [Alicyclobacillus hesperidum]
MRKLHLAIASFVTAALAILVTAEPTARTPAGASLTNVSQHLSSVRVMAIGGSIAHGWDDTPSLGGYLARTFRSLSQNQTTYVFTNESSEGKGPSYYVTRMNALLAKDKPNLVVISFGMLNDLFDHHPISEINQDVVAEVRDALAHDAQVVLVTPPVVGASYVEFKTQEGPTLTSEIRAVEALRNPNVHVVDLFSQMKTYLREHHQTWEMYAADGWHPNAAGHALAASILTADLKHDRWLNQTPIPPQA